MCQRMHGWTNEAMAVCMMCNRCKAFGAGADEKNGVYGHFIIFVKTFLRQHHSHSLRIVHARGSSAIWRRCAREAGLYQSLMQEQDNDPTVEVFLKVIFPTVAVLCQRIYKYHLSGGVRLQLDTTDPVVRQKYQSGPKISKYAESVFSLLDHLSIKVGQRTVYAESVFGLLDHLSIKVGQRTVYAESVFGLLDHLSIKVGQRAVYAESVFGLIDHLSIKVGQRTEYTECIQPA